MRVVHCKREAFTDYIGRGSALGNPFTHLPISVTKASVQVATVADSIHCFREWMLGERWQEIEPARRKEAWKAIADLKADAILGCYCKYKPDSICHGDVVLELKAALTKRAFSKVNVMAINSDTLIENLALVDENILAEAARQPLLFIDAVRYRVHAMRKRSQAVAELDYRKSRLALSIRGKRSEAGEKATNALVDAMVEKHSIVRGLRDNVERAFELEEFSKLILEAYRMRRDAIRVIAESQIAEGRSGVNEVERIEQSKRIRASVRKLDEKRNRVARDEEE